MDRYLSQRLVRHARQLRRRFGGPALGRDRRPGAKATGRTDGLWAVDTEGEARATSKLFFRVRVGAEMCGPLFTPDDETAFVAVQHPADGGDDWEGFGRPSYYEDLSTRWPDFKDDMPTRQWYAERKTKARPGSPDSGWVLCVKRGNAPHARDDLDDPAAAGLDALSLR